MKITKLILCGLLSALFLNSCSNDDDNLPEVIIPEGDYTNGFFVLNEGGIGSVTYVSNDLQTVEQEIFQTVNAGDDIGAYAQSMFFDGEKAFIISNGSNLITVVNRYTFELIGKVESGLEVPMYGVAHNGKAYVTNLASFDTNTDDYVAVIDIETLEIEESVVINDYADDIVEENGIIYIKNSSYGSGNKISVFNTVSNVVDRTIEVSPGFNSFTVENNFLYALSSTNLDVVDLGTNELIRQITFPEDHTGARNLDVEDNNIYYTIDHGVYTISTEATEPAETPIFSYSTTSQWGVMYGFEVEDDRIYIADGGDFSSNSFIEVYTLEGELLQKITVGVGPNGFYFND